MKEDLAVERGELTSCFCPGIGKAPPVKIFVVASDKDDFLAGQPDTACILKV